MLALLPAIFASGAPAGGPHDHGFAHHHHHEHTLPTPLPRHAFDPSAAVQPFGLSAVRLLPNSAFAEAQDLNTEYLRQLDIDRLLHSFRTQAGLANPAPPYGGWESPSYQWGLVNGHFVGHYLSALAFATAAGNEDLRSKGAQLVAGLAACQDTIAKANPDRGGWLSAYPIDHIERLEAHNLTQVWAPYYTLHKIMAGLYDHHMLTTKPSEPGNDQALAVLVQMANYISSRITKLIAAKGAAWWQWCLDVEFGGMNELAYNLYSLTKDQRHAQLAALFSPDNFLNPLAHGTQDPLDGLHANQHLPIIVGAARGFEVMGNKTLGTITHNFGCLLSSRYEYSTGGSSDNEYWGNPRELGTSIHTDFDSVTHAPMNSDGYHTQETCSTYNSLKISRYLFTWAPTAALADAFEAKLLNGILGVQQPGVVGSLSYMTPLGRGVNRNRWDWYGFGNANSSFWCCYGTTVEQFAKLGDSIYFTEGIEQLWVAQYIPSTLSWAAKGLSVVMTSSLAMALPTQRGARAEPYTATLTVNITLSSFLSRGPGPLPALDLRVRVPGWAARESAVRVRRRNSSMSEHTPANGTFFAVPTPESGWLVGDVVELTLGMVPRLTPINDVRPEFASVSSIMLGPLVLTGITNETDELRADPARVAEWVAPEKIQRTRCAGRAHWKIWDGERCGDAQEDATTDGMQLVAHGKNRNYTLLPLARVALLNYTAYFNVTKPV